MQNIIKKFESKIFDFLSGDNGLFRLTCTKRNGVKT